MIEYEVKLNFKLDEPTVNNHLYDTSCLLKEFNRLIAIQSLYITSDDEIEIKINNIIGIVKHYKVTKDKSIIFYTTGINEDMETVLKNINKVSMLCTGTLSDLPDDLGVVPLLRDTKYLTNFNLIKLFIIFEE